MDLPRLQRMLGRCAKERNKLRKERAAINKHYVSYVKNPLIGYAALFGEKSLRTLGKPREHWDENLDGWREGYREHYFDDIKYRSKLREIRDKISALEAAYNEILREIRYLSEQL